MSVQDSLTDLVCDAEDFAFFEVRGKIHKGFLKSGHKILNEITPLLEAAIEEYPTFQIVLVGHSLGAAVASVLTILLRTQRSDWDVFAFLYAPPSVCTL